MKIFLIAGETSGDQLGGPLMAALKAKDSGLTFKGVGGDEMLKQGLQPVFPMRELALFGLFEILPKIPGLIRRLTELDELIRAEKPDLVITIDAPDFNFRLAKKLQGSTLPVVHYVAPSVWAWRPGRAKKIQPLFKHLLALFPFEPPYFTKVGLPATFVGHPLVNVAIGEAKPLTLPGQSLIVLPGSRRSELHYHLPILRETLALLKPRYPYLNILLPTVPHLRELVVEGVKDWPYAVTFIDEAAAKYSAMRGATLALAASGTVSLELALAGCPSVIMYKVHGLTAALYRHFIKLKYVSLPNIILGREVMREFIQYTATPENLSEAVAGLLDSPEALAKQREELAKVGELLAPADGLPPAAEAAEVIWRGLNESKASTMKTANKLEKSSETTE
jgi:lipid-A-disaccharide synthase